MSGKEQSKTSETEVLSLVDATLDIMNELIVVLSEELVLLRKRDKAALLEMRGRKNKLLVEYQSNIKVFAAHPDILKKMTKETREKFRSVGLRLNDVAERNASALKGAVEGTKKLIRNVMDFIRKQVLPRHGYSDPRKMTASLGAYSPMCPPVAFNREV